MLIVNLDHAIKISIFHLPNTIYFFFSELLILITILTGNNFKNGTTKEMLQGIKLGNVYE